VTLTVGGKRRRVNLGPDRDEAFRKFRDLTADLTLHDRSPATSPGDPNLTLVELADLYLDWVQLNLKPETYRSRKDTLERFVKVHRRKRAAEITPQDIENFKQGLASGQLARRGKPLAVRTVNIHLSGVMAMFNWAVQMMHLPWSPAARVKRLREGPGRTRFLTDDEIEHLLSICPPILQDIITVYLETGLRLQELADLTWDDIDLQNRQLTVVKSKTDHTTKGYQPRVIPLTSRAFDAIARQPHREGSVFRNRSGRKYTKRAIRTRFVRTCRKHGIEGITIHTMRHTFASRLAMRGASLTSIGRLLGHSKAETTQRYAHLADEHLRDVVALLEDPPPDPAENAQKIVPLPPLPSEDEAQGKA
jgi:integrase